MVRKSFWAAFLLIVAVSCTMQVQHPRPTIPYVNGILEDKTGYEYGLLASSSELWEDADIVVMGSSLQSRHFADALAAADLCDNVSGSSDVDSIPDFSGETIVSVIDEANTPYDSIYNVSTDSLRSVVVRLGVAAMDTVYASGRYDLESRGRKRQAKIIVLADECMALYGQFDLDTLFQETGSRTETVAPLSVMADKALEEGRRGMNVLIISDSASVVSGIAATVFEERAALSDNRTATCTALYPKDGDYSLYDFLNDYLSLSKTEAVDAILLDNPLINRETLEAEYSHVVSVDCVEHASYSNVVRPEFKIYESSDCLCRECYSKLRNENRFTHDIYYPRSVFLKAVSKPYSSEGHFMLIPAANVQD